MELKKILCPTDFSDPAEDALKAAASLALDYSAELSVVYVVEALPLVPGSVPHPVSRMEEYKKEMEVAAEKKLRTLIKRVISNEIQVRPLVESGQPAVKVVDLADQIGADLIVIATHGLTGWRKAFLGSVTERVVRLTSKQVLIIQSKPPLSSSERD
jgi:nucleotide-binding universal stress UspA family protein